METSPNEIVPEPSACGGIVLGTIARGPVSCANVLTAQYFVVGLRRAALLVVVAALAAGCAGGPAESGPVTLVFKHAKILGPSDPVPGLLREFEKRHPGVRVQAESLSWNSDDQHQFFVINLEGRGAAFDVMMLDVVWVAEFARAGWLLDLSPWVPRAELAPHFPSTIEPATWDGRVWAMPWLMNVGVLYYRTDLLATYRLAPPRTWEALVDQVVRVRVGIAPLPGRVGGAASAASSGGAHLGVNRRTRHPALAAELVRFLAGADAQKAMSVGGALNPTRMALYRDPDVVRVHPDFPVVHDLMLQARPRPVTPAYLMLSTTLQPEFSAALVGVKRPRQAIEHARLRLSYLLEGLR